MDEKAIIEMNMKSAISGVSEIAFLKSTLFEVLEAGVQQDPKITATQQLGVQLTNSVKRDGVTIIQNQNVQVMSRIVPLMVKALKYCERIQSSYAQFLQARVSGNSELIEVTQPRDKLVYMAKDDCLEEDDDPIEKCCQSFFEREVQWEDFQEEMKQRYLTYVSKQFHTKRAAAEWLNIGATYISKLSRVKIDKSKVQPTAPQDERFPQPADNLRND